VIPITADHCGDYLRDIFHGDRRCAAQPGISSSTSKPIFVAGVEEMTRLRVCEVRTMLQCQLYYAGIFGVATLGHALASLARQKEMSGGGRAAELDRFPVSSSKP